MLSSGHHAIKPSALVILALLAGSMSIVWGQAMVLIALQRDRMIIVYSTPLTDIYEWTYRVGFRDLALRWLCRQCSHPLRYHGLFTLTYCKMPADHS